jgi:uncharacterized protein (DUF58 family)
VAFIDPKVLQKIGRLDLKAKMVVEGFISGMHKSPFKGFSVEFAQHRGYVPGDDLKHLDWKVWGKNERYYIKQYEAETNLVTTVLLDTSASMAYRGAKAAGRLTKLEWGRLAAAALSYLVLNQSDAVALGTFQHDLGEWVERSTRKVHINRICKVLEDAEPNGETGVGRVLHTMAERIKRRGIFFIISDLFEDVQSIVDGFEHLRHLGHELVVLQVLDDDELEFPFEGMVQFKGLELTVQVKCHPRSVREAYLQEMHQHLAKVKAACQRANIDYVLANTSHPVDVALSAYLQKRERVAAAGSRGAIRA